MAAGGRSGAVSEGGSGTAALLTPPSVPPFFFFFLFFFFAPPDDGVFATSPLGWLLFSSCDHVPSRESSVPAS